MHPDRRRRTADLELLAQAGRWQEVYRRLALYEFGHEIRMGLQLAFLRPFCAPRMAKVLVEAGNLINEPLKRAYDTGLIIYELIANGTDSNTGHRMVSVMNRAHHGRGITDEDMTYVLCAFIVCPLRYVAWTGWRPLTDVDRDAALHFYRDMGRLMNIKTMPETYAEAERILDDYEAANIVPSPEAKLLGDNLIEVLKDRLPGPARPIARQLFSILIDQPQVSRALGYTPLPAPAQTAVRTLGRGYGLIQRQTRPSDRPVFVPGNKAGKAYPHGYTLDQLGPYGSTDQEPVHPSDGL